MRKLYVGLIGYGHVGQAVVKLLKKRKTLIKNKFNAEFAIKTVCDRSIQKKKSVLLAGIKTTKNIDDILKDPKIDIVIELIGGTHPAQKIICDSLKNGKHVVTANKELIARKGSALFNEARAKKRSISFESSVGAGIPIIKTITEGIAGNKFTGLYGIINGTCNFILTEMSKSNLSFADALKEAQKRGFAESNPTLDINGMDAAHKLAILVALSFGKCISIKNMHVEGITHISHHDIEHAESLNLTIKHLAIAKRINNDIEARVHPTLIPKEHPLASVNGIYNAFFLDTKPLGDVLLSGKGAGPMTAASGVVSDLINLATVYNSEDAVVNNPYADNPKLKIRKIDEIQTEFYIRFIVIDRPGVLSNITGILGKHGISIASVTQKMRKKSSAVPIIMLTHHAKEHMVRKALEKIHKLPAVKGKPVAIRMEEF